MFSVVRGAFPRTSTMRAVLSPMASQVSSRFCNLRANPSGKEYAISQRVLRKRLPDHQKPEKTEQSESKIISSFSPLDSLDKKGWEKVKKGMQEIEEFNRSIQKKD